MKIHPRLVDFPSSWSAVADASCFALGGPVLRRACESRHATLDRDSRVYGKERKA
jgi:hypothetical protein